ncbi:MAG: AMP-binding protein [Polyangiales bacterium]
MPLTPEHLLRPGLTLRVGDDALSGVALLDAARRHLGALAARGVTRGARVGVWADGSMQSAISLVAHALGGLASVPLNPSMGARELAHVLADAAPAVVVGAPSTLAAPSMPLGDEAPARVTALDDDALPALVLYTSGTTGAPKGAVLTRRNVASNLDALGSAWGWTADDALLHALPLFHVHGLALGLFGPLRRGARVRVLPRFDPDAVTEAMADATMLFAVPTMYHRLGEHMDHAPSTRQALARARVLVSGSAPLPQREHARIQRLTGRGVLERYGLTETLINAGVRASEGARPGYVGAALEGVSLRLVDDARAPLEDRDDQTLGEVTVKGPNVFAGYLNRPDATAAATDADGWFYTGDLATQAPDGALRIVGRRATDLIKTGGFKVGAGEVEAALLEHPAVREAAVKAVADDDLGERIEAWVVLRPEVPCDPASLPEHVASLIAWHKRPRAVHTLDALPRNAMGKVMKALLGSA